MFILSHVKICQLRGFGMVIRGGIDRNAHNRSGMLWEVERILKERVANQLELPKFLLMEKYILAFPLKKSTINNV